MAPLQWLKQELNFSTKPCSSSAQQQSTESIFEQAVALDTGVDGTTDKKEAASLYRRAVEDGHVTAMYALANILVEGTLGVSRDIRGALELYVRAIQEGNDTDAMFRLRCLLREGQDGLERDVKRVTALLERSAELGNGSTMNVVGVLKLEGAEGVLRDSEKAVKLLEKGVEEGDVVSMEFLGEVYCGGDGGTEINTGKARELFERAIREKGSMKAVTGLAMLYMNGGEGVEKDDKKAKELFECAVEEEDTVAMYYLAYMSADGAEGVQTDFERAMLLYKRVVWAGDVDDAVAQLGGWKLSEHLEIERNVEDGVRLLEWAIDEFDRVDAMATLGFKLLEGDTGLPKDVPKAVQLLEKEAEKEEPEAMCFYGGALCEGKYGVSPDGARGIKLLESAIEKGDEHALRALGYIFCHGAAGVVQDREKAIELCERAMEEHNDLGATHNLALALWDEGNGAPDDRERALELLEGAIKQGHSKSMNEMGFWLLNGHGGLSQDTERATRLFRKAIKCNRNPAAMMNLAYVYETKQPRRKDSLGRAAKLYERAIKGFESGEEDWRTANRSLACLLWKGGCGFRPQRGRAIQLLQRVINVEEDLCDIKTLAKWVLRGKDVVAGDLDYVKKLLRKKLKKCFDPQEAKELRKQLEKCNKT